MNKAIITLALALAALPSFATTSIKATVNGMVCAFCAQGIEKRISGMPATKAVYVDLKRKTVAIEAKEGHKLDEKAITSEITDAGYDVVRLETVQKTVEEIKAEIKGHK